MVYCKLIKLLGILTQSVSQVAIEIWHKSDWAQAQENSVVQREQHEYNVKKTSETSVLPTQVFL